MAKNELTLREKRAETDLTVIAVVTLAVLAVYLAFQPVFTSFARDRNLPVLLRTAGMACMQFGIAGLGITIVSLLRKEELFSYGLRREGALRSIILSALMFLPHLAFLFAAGRLKGYFPFQFVWTTNEVLAGPFPVKLTGMLITVAAWGFFEGYNYAVISEIVNKRYPVRNRFLNWGAILCAVICILIHGVIGVTPADFIETATVFLIIYGMLIVKEYTGNAWGCVFVFIFLWNAF